MQCKNFKNQLLRFDKVTESLKVGTFFETQCIFNQQSSSGYNSSRGARPTAMGQLWNVDNFPKIKLAYTSIREHTTKGTNTKRSQTFTGSYKKITNTKSHLVHSAVQAAARQMSSQTYKHGNGKNTFCIFYNRARAKNN